MFMLIVGAGRVGSAVAKWALEQGHEVSVLDEDPLSHERARAPTGAPAGRTRGGQFTVGTALEIDALIEAGIEQADAFVAVHRRRQHQPRDRADRPAALQRATGGGPRARPGAGAVVRASRASQPSARRQTAIEHARGRRVGAA